MREALRVTIRNLRPLAWAAVCALLLAAPVGAQTRLFFYWIATESQLPAAAATTGMLFVVTNGDFADGSPCQPASPGTDAVLCYWDGDSFEIVGDGTSAGGTGDITAVGDCTTGSCFQSETSRQVFAAPNGGGVGSFRALVEADVSDLSHTADTDTQLTQEQVEDFAGALVEAGTGTHTGVTVTYQDATGDVDFVVGGLTAAELATDSVSADELNASGVEAELEAVLDHNDLQGIGASDHHTATADTDTTCSDSACAVGTDDTVTLPQGTAPTPTAEGRLEWETDDDHLIVGDAVGQVEFVPAEDVSGDVTMTDAGAVTIQADSVALGTDTTGNYAGSSSEGGAATTATALAANGSNCAAGEIALGVDAAGAVEGCYEPAEADISDLSHFTPTDIDTDYAGETVTSTWNFVDVGTGAFGAYDLQVGDTTTPDYGALQLGEAGIYKSSFSSGNIDLDKSLVFRQEGNLAVGNDPGIEFAFLESGNTIRLAIPESGAGNATAFIRSGTFAGPYSAATGNDIVSCAQWSTYDSNIDCDTAGTGADLFVQDDLEVEGTIFAHETINLEGSTADGNQVIVQVGADPGADVTITLPTATTTLVGASHDHDGGDGAQIGDGGIADGAVDGGAGGEIADGTVDANDLATDSVAAAELASTAIQAGDIEAGDLPADGYASTYLNDDGDTATGAFDFSAVDLELPNETTCTATDCDAAPEAGRVCVDTDATTGQQFYICEGLAGWVLQGDGAAGHGDGANCAAGEIALGVDAAGAVQGCYEPAEADISDLAHTATAITDGLIVEADLSEDSGTPTDEDVLTYDTTGANFNWIAQSAIVAGTATALAANGSNCAAGEIALGVDASGAVEGCYEPAEADISDLAHTATAITDGLIIEADLNEDSGTPTDEDVLTYDSTGANFNWIAQSGVAAGTAAALVANGGNCAAGEIALGVDAAGAVEGCYEPTEADITDLSHTADTNLTQEEVEDFAGALVTDGTGTHTDIAITYQDTTGDVDFVVDTLPNLTGTLDVDSGGTGAVSLTDGGILLGSGTGAVTALGAATNGQIPIGDGTTDPVLATITATANETDVTNGAGTITVGIVASPTLDATNITGVVTGGITDGTILEADLNAIDAAGDEECLTSEGTGFEWQDCGSGGAFSDAGDPIVQNTVTKDVHVGDGAGTLAGKLEIGGDADQPQLVVEGFSTQNDSIVVVQNDADTELASIENSGLISTAVGIDAIGDVDLDYGSGDVDDHTFITDGTGDSEIVLPAESIGTTEILTDTIVPADVDETQDYVFTTLSGKQDRNNTAVNDDDCTGEQGSWWYDTTDSVFEWCNANSGVPAVLGGGSTMPPMVFRAQQNEPPTAAYATLDTRNMHPVLDFDASTQEYAVFSELLPPSYGGGGLTCDIWWASTDQTSGAVSWGIAFEELDVDGQDMDADITFAYNFASCTTAAVTGDLDKCTISFTDGADMDNWSAGIPGRVKIQRDADGGDGTDDMTNDAELRMLVCNET